MGWCTAMIHNCLNRRPALKSGVHRQVLMTSIGWFVGYHLTKWENYTNARRDRDMTQYMRLHPEEFHPQEKKTYAEILEDFHPIR
ncbi:NDUC2 dehydrogenase, partial [Amia calva]|nr:NDUC2 dehydrogenase [Amia calva]